MLGRPRRANTNESLVSGASGTSGASQADPATEETGLWYYLVVDVSGTRLRKLPVYTTSAKGSMGRLSEGALVEVSRRRLSGITRWLYLASGEGWLFDVSPKDAKVRAVEVEVSHGEWTYRPLERVPLLMRPSLTMASQNRSCCLGSVDTQDLVVVNKRARPINAKGCFLHTADGRGWLMDFYKGRVRFERCDAAESALSPSANSATEAHNSSPPELERSLSIHSGKASFDRSCTLTSTMTSTISSSMTGTMSSLASEMPTNAVAEYGEWTYLVLGRAFTLRSGPTISQVAKIKDRLSEGQLVKVVERRQGNGTTFLRLESPSGWAFEFQPGCRDKKPRLKEVVVEQGSWHYRVCTPNGIALRSGCCMSDASKMGAGPREGALLATVQRVQAGETAFLKLKDGASWVFDQKGSKTLLEGPISLEDLRGKPATVAVPGGVFLLQHPTKKSWARTKRLLLQDAKVRVGLTGDLEGQTWAQVSQQGGMDGWLPISAVELSKETGTASGDGSISDESPVVTPRG